MSALQKNVDMNHAPEQGLEEDNKKQACRKDVWGWPASISHKTPGCLQGATFAGDTRPLAVSVSHIQANDHLVQVMWLKAKQNCIAGTEALQTHVETNHAPEQGLEEDNKNQACRYICGRLADMSQAGWRDTLRPHTQNLQNREFFRSSLIMQVGACSWHNQLGALATPDVR